MKFDRQVWAKPPTSSRIRCEDCDEQLANCRCMDWEDIYNTKKDENG